MQIATLRTWTRHDDFKEGPDVIDPRFPALAIGHCRHRVDIGRVPEEYFAV